MFSAFLSLWCSVWTARRWWLRMLPTKARCDAFLSIDLLRHINYDYATWPAVLECFLVQFYVLITALNKGYGRKRRYRTRRLAVKPLLPWNLWSTNFTPCHRQVALQYQWAWDWKLGIVGTSQLFLELFMYRSTTVKNSCTFLQDLIREEVIDVTFVK